MQLTLTSSDEQSFQVDRQILKQAGTIETLITTMGLDDADDDAPTMPIPLPNVAGNILKIVIDWLTMHKDDPVREEKEDDGERNSEDITPEDRAFLKDVPQDTVFGIMLGANYLDIKGLLEVTVKTIANILKTCKDHEEIRAKFGVRNDFTPEEEAQTKKENEWCVN